MNIVDVLNEIWNQILEVTALFVHARLGRRHRPAADPRPARARRRRSSPSWCSARSSTWSASRGSRSASRRVRASPRSAPAASRSSRSGLPVLPARRARSTRPGTHPLRALPRRARGHLPDVRRSAAARDRHLHELRPRPQGQDRGPSRSGDGRAASPAARSPDAAPAASTRCRSAVLLVRPLLARRDPRRARVRGPRRPRRDAGQRPADAARAWSPAPPAGLRRRRDRLVRRASQARAAASGPDDLRPRPAPCRGAAIGLSLRRLAGARRLAAAAGDRRRARAVGQHVRVQRRLRVLDARRLPRSSSAATRSARSGSSRSASRWRCCSTPSSLPSEIEPLVPALQNAPLLTIHVGMAVISYGIFATSFAAGVAYLVQGQDDRFAWLPSHKVLDEVAYRAVIIGFPIFATMIILGLVVGVDRLVALLGLGPEGDRGARHLADLRGLPARAQPALVGRPAGGAAAGRRVRDGARDLLRARSGSAACTPTAGCSGQRPRRRPPMGSIGTSGCDKGP